MSSSNGLIGGLSSIVQEKKDNRKDRKTKRKKEIKKTEKNKNSSEDRRRKSQNRQEEGKKDAPVQDSVKVKGELQPKIIFCLLTCFSTKERQVKRLPSHRRRSVENSGRKITIFSAAVAARSVT